MTGHFAAGGDCDQKRRGPKKSGALAERQGALNLATVAKPN